MKYNVEAWNNMTAEERLAVIRTPFAKQKYLKVIPFKHDCEGYTAAQFVEDTRQDEEESPQYLDKQGNLLGIFDEDYFVDLITNHDGAELPRWAPKLKKFMEDYFQENQQSPVPSQPYGSTKLPMEENVEEEVDEDLEAAEMKAILSLTKYALGAV